MSNTISKGLMVIFIGMFLVIGMQIAFSEYDEYSSQVMFTIPWGYDLGEISPDFMLKNPVIPAKESPGPWTVSNEGVLAIVFSTYEDNYEESAVYLNTYDCDGTFLNSFAFASIEDVNFCPQNMAFSETGELAVAENSGDLIVIFTSELEIDSYIRLPLKDQATFCVEPSSTGGFWVLYLASERENQYGLENMYLCSLTVDGVLGTPILVWDGVNKQGIPADFVTPYGECTMVFKDMYGYFYGPTSHISGELGSAISKSDSDYIQIYRNDWKSDEDWNWFDIRDPGLKFLITWEGDYYTIRATDAGMVLTKYTLQHE